MFDPCIGEIVTGTLAVYRAAGEHLRPTPARSHYIFNLRDYFKVVQVSNSVNSIAFLVVHRSTHTSN